MPRAEAHDQFVELFGRGDIDLENYKALCSRKGWKTGRTGCFAPGIVPFNKGRKGFCPPGSEKGWFRKGQLPHNTKFLGHERVSKDGYIEISVAETNPHTGYERRYVLKHRHLWENAHGPVPAGMCLKCLDGDKTNVDPSNWELVPRAVNLRLNGRHSLSYKDAEPEVRPVVLTAAKLRHAGRLRGRND